MNAEEACEYIDELFARVPEKVDGGTACVDVARWLGPILSTDRAGIIAGLRLQLASRDMGKQNLAMLVALFANIPELVPEIESAVRRCQEGTPHRAGFVETAAQVLARLRAAKTE